MDQKKGKAFIHRSSKIDFYETPYSITNQLLEEIYIKRKLLHFSDSILEPACGNGAIVRMLKKKGFKKITAYDIANTEMPLDFFKEKSSYDWVITNPPYLLADEFVEKAREVSLRGFVFFMRINFLSGQKRFRDNRFKGLKWVFILTRMPDLRAEIRDDGKYPTAGIVYAWYMWKQGYLGYPIIKWIDNGKYVLRKEKESI